MNIKETKMDNGSINDLACFGLFFSAYAGIVSNTLVRRSSWDKPPLLYSSANQLFFIGLPNIVGSGLIIFFIYRIYSINDFATTALEVAISFAAAFFIQSRIRKAEPSLFLSFLNNGALSPLIFAAISAVFFLLVIS